MGKGTRKECRGPSLMSADFFAMGGYAFYVWTSFGVTALVLIANAWVARRREKSLLKSIAANTENTVKKA